VSGLFSGFITGVGTLPRSIYRAANQRSLSDLGDVPKMCAHVAAQCYKIPEPLPIGKGERRREREVSGTISSGKFRLEEDTHFKNRYFALYFEHQHKLAILGYTGTRFGTEFFLRDVATDVNVGCSQSSDPFFVDVLRAVSGRVSGKRGYTLVLTGHSLGGTRALMSSHHPVANDRVGAVHVFNAGAGPGADARQQRLLDEAWSDPNILKAYGRGIAYVVTEGFGSFFDTVGQGVAVLQGAGGQPECTRKCHHIFGDPISMLNASSSHMEVITYEVHPDAEDRHSMQNFVKQAPNTAR